VYIVYSVVLAHDIARWIPFLSLVDLFCCPECGTSRLRFLEDTLTCEACGWETRRSMGVIDILKQRRSSGEAQLDAAEQERALLAALGLAGDEDDMRAIRSALEPLQPIGHGFFDAEENLFLERFCIENFEPKPILGPVYLPRVAKVNSVFNGSVRIRNGGAFPISSNGENAVTISYHWRRNGQIAVFEGARSSLPVPVAASGCLTVPLLIHAPDEPGHYELQVVALQEFKRWFDDRSVSVMMEIDHADPPNPPDRSGETAFSGVSDEALSSGFIDRHFEAPESAIVLEIGGGINPSFRASGSGRTWPGTFINCDVSLRLLRLAALLARRRNQQTVQARFDANDMPIPSGTLDAVFVSRALHHFENLNTILAEIARVLKKNGTLFLLCEPVGIAYDDYTKLLIRNGVNEQIFPMGVYTRAVEKAGLRLEDAQCDWGFSFKGLFRK
jgi:hypothetical protein